MKGDIYSGLSLENGRGVRFSKNEVAFIAENIKRILSTRRGERVNEPQFGSDVKKYLFMPQVRIDDLMAEIKRAIETQEPRVIVNSCTLTSADINDVVQIKLTITILDGTTTEVVVGI